MTSNHKVFMIGWEYPPYNSGGLGVACEGLTKALSQQNTQLYFTLPHSYVGSLSHMQVLSCADPSWGSAQNQANLYGVSPLGLYEASIQLQNSTKKGTTLDSRALSALPQSELEAKVDKYAEIVSKQGMAKSKNYDVIHAHDWMSFPAGMALAKKTGKPLITHVHSTEHDRIPSGTGSHYIHHTEYEGLQASARVVAVSEYTKKLLIDKYAINPNKIDVVHNGIDPLDYDHHDDFVNFAQERPIVVFMGRLTAQKGAPYFLALATQVLRMTPEALFIVAGDGDMYHELLFSTAMQRLSASVLFSGFVRDKQKDLLLSRADVFVMPSLSEPFGLVALEAAQRHTPVIISKNAGVSEVLPHAIALDFWDLHKMSATIVQLIKDQGFSTSVVSGQTQDLQSVTWENAAHKLRQTYNKALFGLN